MRFRPVLQKWKRKKIIKTLKTSSPLRFEKMGEKAIAPTYKCAVANSPAYRDFLLQQRGEIPRVETAAAFSARIPLLNKENYFSSYRLDELAGKKLGDIKLAMTSSGYSGKFAYGFSSAKAVKKFRLGIDTSLDYIFDISNRKTFLINCAPMGVHIDTSLPLAETSVRSDMVIALLKKVSPWYDQTILIGDPYFIKKLVEDAERENIRWSKLNVSIVTAQDWLPESLRSYLADRLELNPDEDHRTILTTMGMSELGINVFHESRQLIRLRRAVVRDNVLQEMFCQPGMKAPPLFYHYYPFRTHIESVKSGELVFTALDREGIIPVIRYVTGDAGKVFRYEEFCHRLEGDYDQLIPDLKLPVGIIYGRTKHRFMVNGQPVYIEDLKESLYSDKEVAASVTGLIKFDPEKESPQLLVHLKKGMKVSRKLTEKLDIAIQSGCTVPLKVEFKAYHDFPDALSLSYEQKLKG